MPNIFVVCNRHNEVELLVRDYGTLIYLCHISMPRFRTAEMYSTFYPILKSKSQKEDYILLSGLSVMNAVACSIFSVLHKRLNLLIHSKVNNRYEVRRIRFDEGS